MSSDELRVFISYRREESAHFAGRLADTIVSELAQTKIFIDVDTIEPGSNFVESITDAVSSCDVLIAVIGPRWLSIVDAKGDRRLHDPHDFIAREISIALQRQVGVIPVLVDGATIPTAAQLPPELRELSRRHAIRLDHDTFRTDVERLISTLSARRRGGARSGAENPTRDNLSSNPERNWQARLRPPEVVRR